jgi:hypothetical protein
MGLEGGASMSPPDRKWVILLWDPDCSDTSPWSVEAPTLEAAIARAKADWHAWLNDDEDGDDELWAPDCDPEVGKCYLGWIDERVFPGDEAAS